MYNASHVVFPPFQHCTFGRSMVNRLSSDIAVEAEEWSADVLWSIVHAGLERNFLLIDSQQSHPQVKVLGSQVYSICHRLSKMLSCRERVNEILELPGVKAAAARAKEEAGKGKESGHSSNGASAASNGASAATNGASAASNGTKETAGSVAK